MKTILSLLLMLSSSLIATAAEVPAKTNLCIACHGQQGISPNPQWPNIAGQHAKYLAKQLQDYKGKSLVSPVMTPIASTLSDKDIEELANYYAKQTPAQGQTPKKYLARGEQLYRGGDISQHISACIACHGPQGTGNAQAGFPLLSGQHAAFTVLQLQAFKDKKRANDLNSIMQDISKRMTKEDMEAVAHYIQGLW